MQFIQRCLVLLFCSAVLSAAYANVCDQAWHTPANDNDAQELWERCEAKVKTSGTAKDFYIYALYKKQHFMIAHSEGNSDLLHGRENNRFRTLQERNYKYVISLLKKSADKGYIKAQYRLGEIYSNESYGANPIFAKKHLHQFYNLNKSFYWYSRAAKRGDADAQMKLAQFYLDGKVVNQDVKKAFTLLTKSAKQSNASAAHSLALSFTKMQSKATSILGYAWFLYYKKLESMSRYSTSQSNAQLDDLFKLVRRARGRTVPIPPQQKKAAETLLEDLENGRYNNMGIPRMLTQLSEH